MGGQCSALGGPAGGGTGGAGGRREEEADGGGAEGIRTPDPHNAIVVLYQLSYDPTTTADANRRWRDEVLSKGNLTDVRMGRLGGGVTARPKGSITESWGSPREGTRPPGEEG